MEDIKEAIETPEAVATETDTEANLPEPSAEAPMLEADADTPPAEPEETPEEAEVSPLEALMMSGLSEKEAELILNYREGRRLSDAPPSDSLPRMAHSPRLNISYGELMEMKEIFSDLSDTEINRLYNKVTK